MPRKLLPADSWLSSATFSASQAPILHSKLTLAVLLLVYMILCVRSSLAARPSGKA